MKGMIARPCFQTRNIALHPKTLAHNHGECTVIQLTQVQAEILEMIRKGMGQRTIARKRNRSEMSINKTWGQLRAKGATEDEIASCEAIVLNHQRGRRMTQAQIEDTPSFKRLQVLKATK